MKRLLIIPIALCAGLLIILLFGRTPSDYAILDELTRFHEERRNRAFLLTHQIARAEGVARTTGNAPANLARLKRDLTTFLRTPRRTGLGGWEALYLPQGAEKPDPESWFIWGESDPSNPNDDVSIKGKYVIWIRPTGALARVAIALRLAP